MHGTSGKKGILQMASNHDSIQPVAYTSSYRNVFLFALPPTVSHGHLNSDTLFTILDNCTPLSSRVLSLNLPN